MHRSTSSLELADTTPVPGLIDLAVISHRHGDPEQWRVTRRPPAEVAEALVESTRVPPSARLPRALADLAGVL